MKRNVGFLGAMVFVAPVKHVALEPKKLQPQSQRQQFIVRSQREKLIAGVTSTKGRRLRYPEALEHGGSKGALMGSGPQGNRS